MNAFAWLLVIYVSGMNGGLLTIPGISTKTECEHLAWRLRQGDDNISSGPERCIRYEVAK